MLSLLLLLLHYLELPFDILHDHIIVTRLKEDEILHKDGQLLHNDTGVGELFGFLTDDRAKEAASPFSQLKDLFFLSE